MLNTLFCMSLFFSFNHLNKSIIKRNNSTCNLTLNWLICTHFCFFLVSFSSCGWGSNFSGRWRRGPVLISPQPCIFFIQIGQNIIFVYQQMSKSCLTNVMVGRKCILSNCWLSRTDLIQQSFALSLLTEDYSVQYSCDCYYASSMSLDHFWTSNCWGGGVYVSGSHRLQTSDALPLCLCATSTSVTLLILCLIVLFYGP